MSRRRIAGVVVFLLTGAVLSQAAGAVPEPLPPPTITAKPPQRTNAQTARFEFESSDRRVIGFECSFDDDSYEECTSPAEYPADGDGPIGEGDHHFAVHALQGSGSQSEPATWAWTIDITPPQVTLATPEAGVVTDVSTPIFSGTAGTAAGDRGRVVVEISVVGVAEPPVRVGAPVGENGDWTATAPVLADGHYVARARQLDEAGNSATARTRFIVDTTPPVLWVPREVVVEATSAAGAIVDFDVAAGDALDPAPAVVCDPPSGTTFAPAPTAATVACTATDHAGNSANRSFTVTVQNTIAPAPVAGLGAVAGHRMVVLAWRQPTNWDYDHVVISRARPGGSWTAIGTRRAATSFTDRSVANDRIYLYRIESVDTASNTSAPVDLRARPSAFFQPAYLATVRAPVLLRWKAVARATYYNVQVWRNGRKILSRWPTTAGTTLRSSWRFAGRVWRLRAGTYTVYAWPGFGPKRAARYGALRGWTRFVVR